MKVRDVKDKVKKSKIWDLTKKFSYHLSKHHQARKTVNPGAGVKSEKCDKKR